MLRGEALRRPRRRGEEVREVVWWRRRGGGGRRRKGKGGRRRQQQRLASSLFAGCCLRRLRRLSPPRALLRLRSRLVALRGLRRWRHPPVPPADVPSGRARRKLARCLFQRFLSGGPASPFSTRGQVALLGGALPRGARARGGCRPRFEGVPVRGAALRGRRPLRRRERERARGGRAGSGGRRPALGDAAAGLPVAPPRQRRRRRPAAADRRAADVLVRGDAVPPGSVRARGRK